VLGLSTDPTSTSTGLTLGTHQATRQQWKDSCGNLVLDAFTSIGGDHGPSDTLFNATYVVPFLGLDQTGDVDPEITVCGAGDAGTPSEGGTGGSSSESSGCGCAVGGRESRTQSFATTAAALGLAFLALLWRRRSGRPLA